MPLLDRDGKPYKVFSEPNPIVKDQITFSEENLILHNLQWESIKDSTPLADSHLAYPPKEQVSSKEPIFVQQAIPEKPKTLTEDSTVIVHCHPSVVKEKIDEFYGETRTTVSYGQKFEFEAVIMDFNDLQIRLFSNQIIPKDSILYPSIYKDGEPLEMFRWWRVNKTEAYKNGFIIFGEITENHRDFS